MEVTLIGYSVANHNQTHNEDTNPDKIVYSALAQCYNASFNPKTDPYPQLEKMQRIIGSVIKSGHQSVAEHVSFSFLIEGVSRALSHQLVRHRLASYSQKSQRYTDGEHFDFVIPPLIEKNNGAKLEFIKHMESVQSLYGLLREHNVPHEDARFVLPNACTTSIVMTMNIRSWGEFLSKRMCTRAQWEIRALAKKLSTMLCGLAPTFFKDNKLGYAACVQNGFCKEDKCCGLFPRLTDLQESHTKLIELEKSYNQLKEQYDLLNRRASF